MPKPNLPSLCNQATFDKIYREHVRLLYHYVYYQTKNKELAEDILQETFLALWERCGTIDINKVKPYLFRTAKNIYLNKIDRGKVAQKYTNQLQKRMEIESPLHILEQKEFQLKLEKAIDRLTPSQKEVFLLNRIDKLKYREIAELLDISQKAVEKRMHLALIEMRKLYDKI